MSGHPASFEVISRDASARATLWRAICGRHLRWDGPTYEAVEDEWRKHVHAETGTAPAPMGNRNGRWMPRG
jgi:hypothetical protein